MINYYEILGLQQTAGIQEIKSAFRQLAKQFHPDVNPAGKEQFTKILKAYEVLSDPNLKYSYDYRLNAHTEGIKRQKEAAAPVKSKNWRFDDRELKRRQYYNEHIKKYEKKTTSSESEPTPKSSYNEFKYILFATPLAVIIFLGIMTLASGNQNKAAKSENSGAKTELHSDLKMGDAPFTWHFGQAIFDTSSHRTLTVKNMAGKDLIVCLFSNERFIRSFFIEKQYYVEVSQLPDDALSIRYSSGLHFDENKIHPGTEVTGGFKSNEDYYESNFVFRLNSVNELTLHDGINEGFVEINAVKFFRK